MSFTPSDSGQRQIACDARGRSLVIEAGAGTGKTTLLVDRIVSMLRSGDARLTEIAAVTFTENAAAAMKLRLRERLELLRVDHELEPAERTRAQAALDVLERAQVSTIHALCAAILQERPLESGVVPGFRVADEALAESLFSAAWEEWLADRLDASDPVLAEALRQEIPLEAAFEDAERSSLRGLARTLLWERDLAPLVAETRPDPEEWRRELLERAARSRELRALSISGDALADALQNLEAFAEGCRFLRADALATHLLRLPRLKSNVGRAGNWRNSEALARARDVARWTGEALDRWRAQSGARLHADLVTALGGVLERYEHKKRREGVLDFVDLLVKARDALRDSAAVRHHARARFRHLVIDEFQDTDPLQVQVAELLAGDEPGRLVVVGDAKQSIYRFRRADVALFRALRDKTAASRDGSVLHLTQNFRSRPAILRFVNRVFADLILESADADQPEYEAIEARSDLPETASVVALGFDAPEFADRNDLLVSEAAAAAACIARAAAGGFEVRDAASGRPRASRAGDVMVLAPRLTQIRHLEDALDLHGIPFAVDGGKSFFNRLEVHELLATLRAIEDPSDRVSLVAALRSCFFGVSDRDLVAFVLADGVLWPGRDADPALPGAVSVGPALALLGRLHRQRLRVSVPALIERLYDETRVLAALTGTRRGAARRANLEKVVALARQAEELGALTLRGFVRVLAERVEGSGEEPDLPTTRPDDPDTVRILSIHKAKGLEAPIVLLHDLAASLQVDASVIALWQQGRVAVGFRMGCRPPGWKELAERDKAKARAEGRRLLYVACTRARDWLVVPQPPKTAQTGDFWKELLPYLGSVPAGEVTALDASTLPAPEGAPTRLDYRALAGADGGDAVAARWQQERRALVEAAQHLPFVRTSATLEAERETSPWLSVGVGAGGREFGSLVHGILEWIDFERPEAASAIARALAPRFGVAEADAELAAAQVRAVLALPVVQRARSASRVWRELRLWFPDGDRLVTGRIDLVFEEPDGALVIVDYKTDRISEPQALAQAALHAPQLQLYGRGLAQAAGTPTRLERVVVFTQLARAIPV